MSNNDLNRRPITPKPLATKQQLVWISCVVIAALCLQPSSLLSAEKDTRASQQDQPNILFIAIDDLNDWVGCLEQHPRIQTPNIDKLAARGTLFTNAHCQAPLCNPSRTSLLTGLRPSTTGVYGLAPWFRATGKFKDVVTLPQALSQAGYTTLTCGKIWHGGYPPRAEREQEFDVWGVPSSVGARPAEKLVNNTPGGNHPLVDWGVFPHQDEDKGDWKVASWAVEQLENPPQGPFFLSVGFFLPHVPCYTTEKWTHNYPMDRSILPPIKPDDRDDTPDFSWNLHWDLPEPRTSWLDENDQLVPLNRAYLASIEFVDSQVGRVLEALEKSGRQDNTIVVLWSDHGFHLGEKGISGKNSLWERSTRVPLILAGPGITAGQHCSRPAELLDLYPTLLDLLELEPNTSNEGISLVPQLVDANSPRERPAITTHNQGNHGIRSERYRYIRYADGSEELYDHLEDPNEWTNLAENKQFAEVLEWHRNWLPEVDVEPMEGSQHRVLTKVNGAWYWEGKPIVNDDRIE